MTHRKSLLFVTFGFLAAFGLSTALLAQDGVDPAPHLKGAKGPGPVKADIYNDRATGKETPRVGGEVTIHFRSQMRILCDWIDNSAVCGYMFQWLANSLTTLDRETWEYIPDLAESWIKEDVVTRKDGTQVRGMVTETPEGCTVKSAEGETAIARDQIGKINRQVAFTFKLRKEARWQDGHPVTAKDIYFSWQLLRNPHLGAPNIQNYYQHLTECTVIDDHTVRLVYDEQYWMAFDTSSTFAIRPKHILDPEDQMSKDPDGYCKKYVDHPFHVKPVFSGPYRVESWKRDHSITLSRVANHWDKKRAGYLEKIHVRFMPDMVAALQALKNGEIDFMPLLTPEQFYGDASKSAEFSKNYAKVEYILGNYGYVGWNMRKPPFDNRDVRLAMDLACFDKVKFLKEVLYESGVITTGNQFIFGKAYDHSLKPRPYDPQKADELLLEAGWYDRDGDGLRDKDGQPFRFELLMPQVDATHPAKRRADIYQANLKKLGIDMQVRMLEWGAFLEKIEKLEFDACTLSWVLGNPPSEGDPYQIWHSSQAGINGSNHVGFVNEAADRLIETARGELDPEKRRAMYKQLHKILYEEQPYMFLYQPAELGAISKRFRNVKFYLLRPGYDPTEWYIPEEEAARK